MRQKEFPFMSRERGKGMKNLLESLEKRAGSGPVLSGSEGFTSTRNGVATDVEIVFVTWPTTDYFVRNIFPTGENCPCFTHSSLLHFGFRPRTYRRISPPYH